MILVLFFEIFWPTVFFTSEKISKLTFQVKIYVKNVIFFTQLYEKSRDLFLAMYEEFKIKTKIILEDTSKKEER